MKRGLRHEILKHGFLNQLVFNNQKVFNKMNVFETRLFTLLMYENHSYFFEIKLWNVSEGLVL